jgi:hypothetical protein
MSIELRMNIPVGVVVVDVVGVVDGTAIWQLCSKYKS